GWGGVGWVWGGGRRLASSIGCVFWRICTARYQSVTTTATALTISPRDPSSLIVIAFLLLAPRRRGTRRVRASRSRARGAPRQRARPRPRRGASRAPHGARASAPSEPRRARGG